MYSDSNDRTLEEVQNKVFGHKPVLLNEVLEVLAPKDNEVYLDCTFGGGGHSRAILESANCSLCAIDRDSQAQERAKEFAKDFPNRFEFLSDNFSQLNKLKNGGYAGILMDLGVSSFQLDQAERGFSFRSEGPIDMRMNTQKGISALELIETSSVSELERIIKEYGEEPHYRRAASAIKEASSKGELKTTLNLATTLEKALPKKFGSKIHPATLVFQALRIAVNDELLEIEQAMPKAFERLKVGGILAIISFHSLEDRLVKQFFKKMAGRPIDKYDHSSVQDRVKLAEIITRKPIIATDKECQENPRSRSAKLRAIKKISL